MRDTLVHILKFKYNVVDSSSRWTPAPGGLQLLLVIISICLSEQKQEQLHCEPDRVGQICQGNLQSAHFFTAIA